MKQKISLPGKLWPSRNEKNTTAYPTHTPINPVHQFWKEYKIAILIFLTGLALLIGNIIASAQSAKALQPGDPVPDLTITRIQNYPAKTAKISDFRGKLLILDFWATWCSPCIALIPRMDSLQKQFGGQVQFLPVSNQPAQTVTTFLAKLHKLQPFNLPDVQEDTVLNNRFPHTYLPHEVWIGPDGKLIAVTGDEALTAANIRAVLAHQPVRLRPKNDHAQNPDDSHLPPDPLNPASSTAITHRLLPGYQEDLPSKYQVFPEDSSGQRILATNVIMPDLFKIAFGQGQTYYGRNRTLYEVRDTAALTLDVSGEDAEDWMRHGHVYSYEVRVPPGSGKLAYQVMLADLQRYFRAYDVRIEKRPVTCLALVRTTTTDLLQTKGGTPVSAFDGISARLVNFPLRRLAAELNVVYLSHSPYPVIDRSGYTGRVDLELNANLSDLRAVNRALAKYGLQIQRSEETLDMLVIRDRQTQTTPKP
ncbi:MAG: hypothetical protein JWQ66_4676 [Mucilaginibacter sp.]|nr:hypothetical protein [Mucilaginibacter sp.]